MNFKKLFLMLSFFVLLGTTTFAQPYPVVYVDATNGSDSYTGQNETNLPALTGPKATFAAAKAIIQNGGTIVIKAGTYPEAFDLSTGLPGVAPNNVLSYTVQVKQLNVNTDVVFTGAAAPHVLINKAGLTVNVTQFGGTERVLINPGVAKVVTLTAGTINTTSAAFAINALGAGQLTVTYNITGTANFSNQAPGVTGVGATTGIILNYAGGSNINAGPEGSYASYGGIGQINVGKTAGTTVTFASNIAFNAANTLDVINVTTGGATFSGTINLGRGDIVNAGADDVTVTGLVSGAVSAAATVLDADLSDVNLTAPSTGNIYLNGGITWTGGDQAGAKAFAIFAVDNNGTGIISTGPVNLVAAATDADGLSNSYTIGFNNAATGTLNVGLVTASGAVSSTAPPATYYGILNLTNAGIATVAGGSYRGFWTNTGDLTVNGATTVLGILTNNAATSIINLGANTLTLGGAVAHLTNTGTINASTGGLLVNSGGATSFNGGTLSNLTLANAATVVTLGTNQNILNNITVPAGTLVIANGTLAAPTTATGLTTVTGTGIFTVNTTIVFRTQDFLQETNGTVNLTAGVTTTLDVKGNFSRTGGTFNAGANSLVSFTGTIAQTVDGGPLFQVVNITFTNSVSGITVNNTIRATGTATISTATTVNFGTVNLVLNSATAKIINNGLYNTTANSGGGVILGGSNLVPLGFAGGGQTMEGTGIYSYVTVDVGGAAAGTGGGFTAFVVATLTGVKFNGVLRLYSGDLDVQTAGVDFSPFGTSAKIIRHLFNGAGQTPSLTATGGTFNTAAVTYDLEYANGFLASTPLTVDRDVIAGSLEFPVALRVKDLTISATGTFPTPGSADLTANRTILGNLNVVTGAVLQLSAATLTANKTGAAHVVSGTIEQGTPAVGEELRLTGNGTLTGGAGASNIERLDIATTGAYSVTGMKILGENAATGIFEVNSGAAVTLTMANTGTLVAPNPGNVFNLTVNNGVVTLGYDMEVPGTQNMTVGATGTFDFANFNVWFTSTGTFAGVAASTYQATGATTGGYLQVRANHNINTGGSLVPRIIFDPAVPAAGVFTLTLTGNTGVSDILTNTGDDILQLGALTFTHGGNTWNHGGTATYVSGAGNGVFRVTGNVTANLGANAALPNLTVNNGANTFTLVDNIAGAGVPTITVSDPADALGIFTMTAGKVAFGVCDIALVDAGAVFVYTAGTFEMTTATGITATDNQNGELVFNHAAAAAQSVAPAAGFSIPNVRVVGTIGQNLNIATANNFLVTKRFVFGQGHSINFGGVGLGNLAFGDGCWVERRAANPTGAGAVQIATIVVAPAFPAAPGVIDLYYNIGNTAFTGAVVAPAALGTYAVANEMPAAGTTLRDLFMNIGTHTHTDNTGVPIVTVYTGVLNGSKNVLVNRLFHMISGNYDPEPVATTYTFEMAANSTVQMTNGFLLNNLTPATNTFWLTGGPVTLIYDNTVARNTQVFEFPATAGFVSTLDVRSNAANPALTLHANRSVGDLILNTGAAGVNNVRFNLNGLTLSVTNPASATLTRGILSSESVVGGLYTYATLAVTGNATSTANASVQNVHVTAATVNFAGPFGQTDWEGTGAAPNLPGSVTGVTTTGTATIALFNGNLTSTGVITLNGAHTNGTITASSDVTVATGGSMAASSNLTFIGTANATLTVPAAGAVVGSLTFNKTNNTNTVTLAGGNIGQVRNGGALTTFINGLFVVPSPLVFTMNQPNWGGGQGFTRVGVTGTNISHVVGNVAKVSFNGGGPGLGGSSESRFEFPVGTNTLYRPVALTFNPSFGLPTMPNSTFTVSHVNSNPGGAVALPIADGVATGIDVARYPAFYWNIASAPSSIGPSTLFDLELTARGFTDFDDINNVRIIRRHGLVTDVTNQWLFQGTIGMPYDNEVNGGVPSIIQKNANAGLRAGGAVFTLGMKSNISIKTAIPKQWLVLSQGEKSYNLANVFEGNVGSLTYSAQSSNGTIITTAITGSTLKITPVAIGDAVVTIIASDAANNDFFAYSFDVNVGLTDVEEVAEIPTEFSLSQNYPNPFNPTTNIKFGLPKESNVTLRIFNILGEEVATLVNKVMPAGFHTINFDASRMTSGMYIYRIEADNFVQVKKMLLMK